MLDVHERPSANCSVVVDFIYAVALLSPLRTLTSHQFMYMAGKNNNDGEICENKRHLFTVYGLPKAKKNLFKCIAKRRECFSYNKISYMLMARADIHYSTETTKHPSLGKQYIFSILTYASRSCTANKLK